MKLTENLSPECIKLPLSSHDRCGAIDELVDRLALCQRIQDAGLMRQEMAARKSFCANNVGSLAILSHVQSSTCTQQALAVGRTGLPMARRPYDDRPVDLYFLLVTPLTEPHRHVEAMARQRSLQRTRAHADHFSGQTDLRCRVGEVGLAVVGDVDDGDSGALGHLLGR